jgi:hypothetical protein
MSKMQSSGCPVRCGPRGLERGTEPSGLCARPAKGQENRSEQTGPDLEWPDIEPSRVIHSGSVRSIPYKLSLTCVLLCVLAPSLHRRPFALLPCSSPSHTLFHLSEYSSSGHGRFTTRSHPLPAPRHPAQWLADHPQHQSQFPIQHRVLSLVRQTFAPLCEHTLAHHHPHHDLLRRQLFFLRSIVPSLERPQDPLRTPARPPPRSPHHRLW